MKLHKKPAGEYVGMSGPKGSSKSNRRYFDMCNNGWGGNCCWIIILLILFCGCGNNGMNNNCGCMQRTDSCGCC